MRIWLVTALCIVCADAQSPTIPVLNQQAVAAYQAKDYPTFLAVEKQILTLSPGDTRAIYNAACGEALAGHAVAAVQLLDQLLALKIDPAADNDKDLAGIRDTAEWKQFQQRLATLRQPLVHSSVAFVLADKGLLATSIAVDEVTGDTYIGSSRERKILRRSKDGVVSDFATEKDGLTGVWNLLVDPVRKQLIASTAAAPFMLDFKQEDAGNSGLCIFDLVTGKLVRKAFLPPGKHLLGAAAVDTRGNIFVVDSASAEIYRLRRASSELELFISSLVFRAPKGLALSEDERTLYVSDYVDGIFALEMLSNDRYHLEPPAQSWIAGLEGLTRVPDGFIAVESAVQPNRVIRLRLDAKAQAIASVETLESNHPDYSGPVQGVVSGGDFVYIANSQFAAVNMKTGAFAGDKARPTTVLRLPLTSVHPTQ